MNGYFLRGCRKDGFSLIEMLTVMGILSLTATVAFSSFHLSGAKASPLGTAREIAALVQTIRMDAINRFRRVSLGIDMQKRTISDTAEKRRLAIPASIAVEIKTGKNKVRSPSANASIEFFPDGSSSGATIIFSSRNSENVTLHIPWLTGIPTIEVQSDRGY